MKTMTCLCQYRITECNRTAPVPYHTCQLCSTICGDHQWAPNQIRTHPSSLKPWPNGPPTRAKFTTSMELGIIWPPTWLELARVGSSWLEFDQAQMFAQLEQSFPPFGHLSQLSPSCFVIVMWLRGRIQTIGWFLGSWLDLAVPFGHPPMQVLIL